MFKRGEPVEEVLLVCEGRFYFKELQATRDAPFKTARGRYLPLLLVLLLVTVDGYCC